MCSRTGTFRSTADCWDQLERLGEAIAAAEAVVVGAGAGLSAAAGLTYGGQRFQRLFPDFIQRFGLEDMYSAGFHSFPDLETHWAYWSRHILCNRYDRPVGQPYLDLLKLVEGRDYFILTTNVDHCFQDAGFLKKRLFYTQGDYGLWQCQLPCHPRTYDNEAAVRRMAAEQRDLRIPSELVPHCPVCGRPMVMNLRCDASFAEDSGWHQAKRGFQDFLKRHQGVPTLYLELGVGGNTPGIIKYPFWRLTLQNPRALYACVNLDAAWAPQEIKGRSICLPQEIDGVLRELSPARRGEPESP